VQLIFTKGVFTPNRPPFVIPSDVLVSTPLDMTIDVAPPRDFPRIDKQLIRFIRVVRGDLFLR
jgi:hypothetical protein